MATLLLTQVPRERDLHGVLLKGRKKKSLKLSTNVPASNESLTLGALKCKQDILLLYWQIVIKKKKAGAFLLIIHEVL